MESVLIIDQESQYLSSLARMSREMGLDVRTSGTMEGGYRILRARHVDLVVVDWATCKSHGHTHIKKLIESAGLPELIVLSSMPAQDDAEAVLTLGAFEYLDKLGPPQKILLAATQALEHRKRLKKQTHVSMAAHGFMGRSKTLRTICSKITKAAKSNLNVLITGETGTGKELAAMAIHKSSARAGGRLMVVDCSTLTETLAEGILFGHEKGTFTGAEKNREGLIIQAHQGTLFLDEVGEMPLSIQKTFLRVLESRRFLTVGGINEVHSDFRLISATNRDLKEMVGAGLFRPDLLYRLQTMTLEMPSLRSRSEDIQDIAAHVLKDAKAPDRNLPTGMAPDFLHCLEKYHWPGNVRELIHVMELAIASADGEPVLQPYHLPVFLRVHHLGAGIKHGLADEKPSGAKGGRAVPEYREYKEDNEKNYLIQLMNNVNWNVKKAVEVSRLSRPHLYALLRKHSIGQSS